MSDQPTAGDVLLRPYSEGDPVPTGWTVVDSVPFGLVIYRVLYHSATLTATSGGE